MHLIWDWVVTEFSGERLAAREPLEAEPDAAGYAEAFDGFVGVAGTGGMKAAGAGEKNGQIRFVKTQCEKGGVHEMSTGTAGGLSGAAGFGKAVNVAVGLVTEVKVARCGGSQKGRSHF
jgi:hypothetical protein